jgi:hypothetical protein
MRSATPSGGPIQTGTVSSYSFRGVPAQDRRCGPLASNPTLDTRRPLAIRSAHRSGASPYSTTISRPSRRRDDLGRDRRTRTCAARSAGTAVVDSADLRTGPKALMFEIAECQPGESGASGCSCAARASRQGSIWMESTIAASWAWICGDVPGKLSARTTTRTPLTSRIQMRHRAFGPWA